MGKISVRITDIDEYILSYKVFLLMGGWSGISRSITYKEPSDTIKKYITEYKDGIHRGIGDSFFISMFGDGEIYWFIGSVQYHHTHGVTIFGEDESYLHFSDFKNKFLGYFRELTLNNLNI